jgi:hypothetical protein
MPRNPESRGNCAYCGEVITKRSVSKHLEKCSKWQETLFAAETSSRPVETLWHLRVQDADDRAAGAQPDARSSLQECGQPARWLCIECLYGEEKTGHLCDEHVEVHRPCYRLRRISGASGKVTTRPNPQRTVACNPMLARTEPINALLVVFNQL